MKEIIGITGMSCAACTSAVERSVSKLPGVISASASLVTDSLTVTYNEETVSRDSIEQSIISAGYGIRSNSGNSESPAANNTKLEDAHSLFRRLMLSLSFFIPLFYVNMGHHLGLPGGSFFHAHSEAAVLTELLLLIPIIIAGKAFYVKGVRSLLSCHPGMDTLITLSTGISTAYNLYLFYRLLLIRDVSIRPGFESAGMILTLVTFGKWLEKCSLARTGEAVDKLLKLTPQTAHLIRNNEEYTVAVSSLNIGDLCAVRNGDAFPADGTVVSGNCNADESALTGESLPAEKKPGSRVLAASVCTSGYVVMRCESVGNYTFIAKTAALVEEASSGKAPIAALADRISGIFVPCVASIALLTFILQLTIGGCGFDKALQFAVSVLTVSCPCALGLATPVAVSMGSGTGARYGILFRDAAAFELLGKADTVFLDKTGTVTEGKLSISRIEPAEDISTEELLAIDLALEQFSSHPVAEAIKQYAIGCGVHPVPCENFEALPGEGLHAVTEDVAGFTGRVELYAGNLRLMQRLLPQFGYEISAGTVCNFIAAVQGEKARYLGVIVAADTVRSDAAEAVAALHSAGARCIMLTGDTGAAAEGVAANTGIDSYRAQLMPTDKTAFIQKHEGISVMVGDGINDSAALKAASVGIALGTGTDIAIEAASVIIPGTGLLAAADAVRLGKRVLRIIKENLFWAFFYNVISIPIAAGVFYYTMGLQLTPGLAALCMSCSSVCVVTNALRIGRFKPLCGVKNSNVGINSKEITGKMVRRLYIDGMHCEHCSAAVKKALESFKGVTAEVNLKKKYADVTMDEAIADEVLMAAVKEAGFMPVSAEEPAEKKHGLFGRK